MEFLIYVAVAVIAYYIGWHLRGVVLLANLSVDPDKMIKMLQQVKEINEAEARGEIVDSDKIELNIEQRGNTLYGYAKTDGAFVSQGSDLASVLAEAKRRFPTKSFVGKIAQNNSTKELAQ
jgi:hypothetical protein